jgi:hypothetical protein
VHVKLSRDVPVEFREFPSARLWSDQDPHGSPRGADNGRGRASGHPEAAYLMSVSADFVEERSYSRKTVMLAETLVPRKKLTRAD